MQSSKKSVIEFENFKWLDFTNPDKETLKSLLKEYELDEFQILDSLQIGHLPKFEQSDSHKFLILRAFTSSIKKGSTTINQLSNKIAFFLPLTFIVGVYGMNFHHMPELSLTYGYYIILVGMAVVSLVIYVWFKRNKIL